MQIIIHLWKSMTIKIIPWTKHTSLQLLMQKIALSFPKSLKIFKKIIKKPLFYLLRNYNKIKLKWIKQNNSGTKNKMIKNNKKI